MEKNYMNSFKFRNGTYRHASGQIYEVSKILYVTNFKIDKYEILMEDDTYLYILYDIEYDEYTLIPLEKNNVIDSYDNLEEKIKNNISNFGFNDLYFSTEDLAKKCQTILNENYNRWAMEKKILSYQSAIKSEDDKLELYYRKLNELEEEYSRLYGDREN